MNIMNEWKRLAECLFRLFDPSDSPMEEEISTIGPTDFEEILTSRICLWKSNSEPKTSSLHLGTTPLGFLLPCPCFTQLLPSRIQLGNLFRYKPRQYVLRNCSRVSGYKGKYE